MSHVLDLSDEQDATLRRAAARNQKTPEQLTARLVDALADTPRTIHSTDDELLRALGADDVELAKLAKLESQHDAGE